VSHRHFLGKPVPFQPKKMVNLPTLASNSSTCCSSAEAAALPVCVMKCKKA
jgi:hypothetical protein